MSRWIAIALFTHGWLSIGWSQIPEPLPAYSDVRLLREDATLRAVAFADPEVGIACGDRGTLLRTFNAGVSWQPIDSRVDCCLDDVIWLDRQRVVVVGGAYDRITRLSRGVVLYSHDGGKRWKRAADDELPRLRKLQRRPDGALTAQCEWSHSLLTDQLISHDGGRSWHDGQSSGRLSVGSSPNLSAGEASRPSSPRSSELAKWANVTGIPLAIRDACRVSETSLCAVGDHGVILRSEDGGTTWTSARGEHRQTSILIVANDPQSVPWAMLGSEALESRNRVALLLHQTSTSDHPTVNVDLVSQVAVMLGGSGADRIQSEPSEHPVTGLPNTPQNAVRDIAPDASQWIAVHRPVSLVLDRELPPEIHDAFFQAATSSGVIRVVVYGFDGTGTTALHRDALLPKCGVLASDLFFDAMHYVAPNQIAVASTTLRYTYDVSPENRRGDSVTSGIPFNQSRKLTATTQRASRHQLQTVQARLKQNQRIDKIIRSSKTSSQFAKLVKQTLDQTAKADQFRVAWLILQKTRPDRLTSGVARHEVALEQIASRFPSMSAGRWAALRHEAIRHSLEWQRLRSSLSDSMLETASTPAVEAVPVSPFQVVPTGVQQVSGISPVVVPQPEKHDLTPSRRPVEEAQVDLPWEFHPLVLIAREAARQRSDDGQLQATDSESSNLSRLADANHPEWSPLLRDGPKTILARLARTPPKLDGILSDPCWLPTLPSAGRSPRLQLAYDEDYVYVAMQCHASELGEESLSLEASTTIRDHDLHSVDRMQLWIDTDRDLMTSMQLQVSDAGRTHDAIDGNPKWQPTWYRDIERNANQVTFEIAILRRDLVELPIPTGDVWFLSAQVIQAGSTTQQTEMPLPSQWVRVRFQP